MPELPVYSQYASIVVRVDVRGVAQPLTYSIPEGMRLSIGDVVMVPFGSIPAIGYVVGTSRECPPEIRDRIKPIGTRIENASVFDEALLELATWVAEDTFTDIAETIRLIAPEIMTSHIRATLRLAEDWEAKMSDTRSPAQREVVKALSEIGGGGAPSALARAIDALRAGAKHCPTRVEAPTLWDAVTSHSLPDKKIEKSLDSGFPQNLGSEGGNSKKADSTSKLTSVISSLRRKGVIIQEHSLSPPKARPKVVRVLSILTDYQTAVEESTRLERRGSKRQAELLRALLSAVAETPAGVPTAGLAIAPGMNASARTLADKGLVSYIEVPVYRNPFQLFGEAKDGPPALTDAQAAAARAIGAHIAARDGATILLHGVTGSGKTEVYLDAVARTLADGRTALILVPEIGLTAQLLDLFKARFNDSQVAVLHSALSAGERYDEWRRIKTGEASVVLGARSAAFAPLENLGLIVMDEEHESSYKQDNAPRYHARDVAHRRAAMSGAVLLFGSATPSLESYYQATEGDYELINLSERIDSRPLPPVHVVDLRTEFGKGASIRKAAPKIEAADQPPPPRSIFSDPLAGAIEERLSRGQQIILFLNRRGFATFLLCRDCGHTPACPNCAVSLTYHHGARLMRCHHCDFHRRAPDGCPACHGTRIRPFGLGTEKVEESVRLQFPKARLLRMDRDTMAKKGAHAQALRAFRKGEADILIGTQIVAKGLDFPNVTLVGVVSADTALNVPDFRSAERAFQLLTQVAGRAGRGRKPGDVFIQTFNPEHESIVHATLHDYLGFYHDEIAHRRELQYPPFSHMANLIVAEPNERHAQERIENIASVVRASIEELNAPMHLLGPASCPLSRIKDRYRWHIVLRTEERPNIQLVLIHAFRTLTASDRASLSVDIDPLTML